MVPKNQSQEERMQVYEAGFHIIPTISEDKLTDKVTEIRSLIESNGGTVISEEFPKSRALAYDLVKAAAGANKKYHSAYFGWFKFEAPASSIGAVKDGLDKADYVLRHLIIKTVKENTMSNLAKIGLRQDDPAGAPAVAASPKKAESTITPEEMDKTIEKMVE